SQQQRDGTAALLVQCHLQGTSNGILAGVLVSSEENGKPLGVTRLVGFAKDLDDFRVRKPLGDGCTGPQASPQFSSGNIQRPGASRHFINGAVFVRVGQVSDLLDVDHLDSKL